MLGPEIYNKTLASFNQVVSLLGVPATWTRANQTPPQPGVPLTVGFKTAGFKDEKVLNAYGVGAKIITFRAMDIAGAPPEEFDSLEVQAERYTLDAVFPIHLNNQVIGYRAYVKGQ